MKDVLEFYQIHGLFDKKHYYDDKFAYLQFFIDKPLNIETLHAYCTYRQKHGVKNSTINRELTILRSAINFYNKHHDCNIKNIVNGFKLFEEDYQPRYLSKDECERLLKAAAQYPNRAFYAYIVLLLNTGSRSSEILTLTWENIDFERKILTIRNSLSKSKKTQYKPINQVCIDILNNLEYYHPKIVLYNHITDKPYRTFRRAWLETLDKANLGAVRIHDLRHTFASLLIERGAPLYHVSTLLGHSDTRITQRYAHLSNKALHDVLALLPNF